MTRMKEEWKIITEYPQYMASDLGNIMVLPKAGRSGYILSPRATNHGHLQVCLTNEKGERKMEYVHRLVATAFLRNRKGLNVVCHLDDNPSNNNVSNLQWGTQKMNLGMITDRNTATSKKKQKESWELVVGLYNTNKETYAGKKKQLLKEIAVSLGLSYGYVNSLLYCSENKIKFS